MDALSSLRVRRTFFAACLAIVCVSALVGIAARPAMQKTARLTWPDDPDLYRDIGQAQALLDGAWNDDPLYLGESRWYNPLVPAIVAATSRLTGEPVHRLYARGGPYFNLVAPIGLAAVAWAVFGPWVAVASTFAFIFLQSPSVPPWTSATYSCWLFASLFTQALFYLAIVAIHRTTQGTRPYRKLNYAIIGLLVGLTFLGHTAPALLLGGVLCVEGGRALGATRRSGHVPTVLAGLALAGIVAGIVSLPLTVSIVGRYHLHVINKAPLSYEFWTSIDEFGLLIRNTATLRTALAFVGGILLVGNRRERTRARILLDWATVNAALVAWGYGVQAADKAGVALPRLVPTFHLVFYAHALAAVLAGYAIVRMTSAVVGWITARGPLTARWSLEHNHAAFNVALLLLVVIVSVPLAYPGYRARDELNSAVTAAWKRSVPKADLVAWEWVRANTPGKAVFLASDAFGLQVVGPAGRRTVAVDAAFSSPFVAWKPRADARDRMFAAVAAGDWRGFCNDSERYQVRYVVLSDTASAAARLHFQGLLVPAFRAGDINIWLVRNCGGRTQASRGSIGATVAW